MMSHCIHCGCEIIGFDFCEECGDRWGWDLRNYIEQRALNRFLVAGISIILFVGLIGFLDSAFHLWKIPSYTAYLYLGAGLLEGLLIYIGRKFAKRIADKRLGVSKHVKKEAVKVDIRKTCRGCGTPLLKGDHYCLQCGKPVFRWCNWCRDVLWDSNHCARCGRSFVEAVYTAPMPIGRRILKQIADFIAEKYAPIQR